MTISYQFTIPTSCLISMWSEAIYFSNAQQHISTDMVLKTISYVIVYYHAQAIQNNQR